MKMEQTECSETSAYKIQTPGNYPKESMQRVDIYLLTKIIILKICFHMGIYNDY